MMFSLCRYFLINVAHTGDFISALLPTRSARRIDKYLPESWTSVPCLVMPVLINIREMDLTANIRSMTMNDLEWKTKQNQFKTRCLFLSLLLDTMLFQLNGKTSFKDGPQRNIWARHHWLALVASQAPLPPYIGFPLGQTIGVAIHFSTRFSLYIFLIYIQVVTMVTGRGTSGPSCCVDWTNTLGTWPDVAGRVTKYISMATPEDPLHQRCFV